MKMMREGCEITDWLKTAKGDPSRVEAYFSGVGFSSHRHDTYAIGVTLSGVQQFDYRRVTRNSLPGDIVILYPDEIHDGRAGTVEGFRYKTIYIEPARIQEALGRRALPYIKGGVSADSRLVNAVRPLLEDFEHPLEVFEYCDALSELAAAMAALCENDAPRRKANYDAAETARQYIRDHIDDSVCMTDLETACGHDRWRLSRDFRYLFGVSPYQYLIMRRLDKARALMNSGAPIVQAAVAAGFADQSHFTRHFRKCFGLTPGKWLRMNERIFGA